MNIVQLAEPMNSVKATDMHRWINQNILKKITL